jgi:hypothetical protein
MTSSAPSVGTPGTLSGSQPEERHASNNLRLWTPLLLLAALGSYLVALGFDRLWMLHAGESPSRAATLAIAAALHAAWIVPASRRIQPFLVTTTWLVTLSVCSDGLRAIGFADGALSYALVLHTVLLLIALSASERAPWADRLARWRRGRQRIATELRIGEGVAPWLAASLRRILTGRADRPSAAAFDRVIAEVAEAEDRTRLRIAALTLPDTVRQSMLTAAHTIATRAEIAAAELSIVLERQALDEAAACTDAIAQLPDVTAADRERLSRECEAVVLDLVHGLGRPQRLPPWQVPSLHEGSPL